MANKTKEDIKAEALLAQATDTPKKSLKKVKKTTKTAQKNAERVKKAVQRHRSTAKTASTKKAPAAKNAIVTSETDELTQAVAQAQQFAEDNYKRSSRWINRVLKKESIEKNIFIAFILNLVFSVIELIGGMLSGSVAILSDSVHDLGDAISICFSWLMERKSRGKPNKTYTYGYARFSVLGAFATTLIVAIGSGLVILVSFLRLFDPVEVYPAGMVILAVFGIAVNGYAAYKTHGKGSLNQVAVNLHMLEDFLGWIAVLIAACAIALTGWSFIDPLLSIAIATFLLIKAIINFRKVLDLFLEKTPDGISLDTVKYQVLAIPHVQDVHHIHLWSLDEHSNYATMHVVTDGSARVKTAIRQELKKTGIEHVTVELETPAERCTDKSHKAEPTSAKPTKATHKSTKSDEHILKIEH